MDFMAVISSAGVTRSHAAAPAGGSGMPARSGAPTSTNRRAPEERQGGAGRPDSEIHETARGSGIRRREIRRDRPDRTDETITRMCAVALTRIAPMRPSISPLERASAFESNGGRRTPSDDVMLDFDLETLSSGRFLDFVRFDPRAPAFPREQTFVFESRRTAPQPQGHNVPEPRRS